MKMCMLLPCPAIFCFVFFNFCLISDELHIQTSHTSGFSTDVCRDSLVSLLQFLQVANRGCSKSRVIHRTASLNLHCAPALRQNGPCESRQSELSVAPYSNNRNDRQHCVAVAITEQIQLPVLFVLTPLLQSSLTSGQQRSVS